jgi:hypothetical protein
MSCCSNYVLRVELCPGPVPDDLAGSGLSQDSTPRDGTIRDGTIRDGTPRRDSIPGQGGTTRDASKNDAVIENNISWWHDRRQHNKAACCVATRLIFAAICRHVMARSRDICDGGAEIIHKSMSNYLQIS